VLLLPRETERLWLRQWRAQDREPFAAMCADAEVMQFLSSARDAATTFAAIDKWRSLIDERGWGFWAIEIKHTAEFAGFVGLQIPAPGHPYLPCIEIGWRLARRQWGRRSRAVMERLGMHGPAAVFEHPGVPLGNALRKHMLFRLSRQEWEVHAA
jgi:RimJ/RimL family protein N-acetyltransferase